MADKESIRPVYSELQGYLSQEETDGTWTWEQVNQTIDELNKVTDEDYSRFKIVSNTRTLWTGNGYSYYLGFDIMLFCRKLKSLISILHDEYFSDEAHPFSPTPTTIVGEQQVQSQPFLFQILLEGAIDCIERAWNRLRQCRSR